MPTPVSSRLPVGLLPPEDGSDWVELTTEVLPVGTIHDWAILNSTGAVVVFSGTVRDHAEHRTGVTLLDYEAYESQVVPRLNVIAGEIRSRFGEIGRIALLHRIGPLALQEVSVVVAISAAHRGEAFEAARFGIDTLKSTVPIWKREHWADGSDWGLASKELEELMNQSDGSLRKDGGAAS